MKVKVVLDLHDHDLMRSRCFDMERKIISNNLGKSINWNILIIEICENVNSQILSSINAENRFKLSPISFWINLMVSFVQCPVLDSVTILHHFSNFCEILCVVLQLRCVYAMLKNSAHPPPILWDHIQILWKIVIGAIIWWELNNKR